MKNTVKEKFNSDPKHIKPKMMSLRELIYEVAKNTDGVGELEETLKWGEPAYLTTKSKSEQQLESIGSKKVLSS